MLVGISIMLSYKYLWFCVAYRLSQVRAEQDPYLDAIYVGSESEAADDGASQLTAFLADLSPAVKSDSSLLRQGRYECPKL